MITEAEKPRDPQSESWRPRSVDGVGSTPRPGSLGPQGELALLFQAEGRRGIDVPVWRAWQEGFPLTYQRASLFALVRPSADPMRLTHSRETFSFIQCTDPNVNLVENPHRNIQNDV